MLDQLRKLSLSDKAEEEVGREGRPPLRPPSSNYQLNFRPMPAGVRKKLWEEGYRYRNQRKMKGFRHEKIEWRLPATERPASEKHGPHSSRKPCGHLREADSDHEPLFLPPTKLQLKSRRLKKLYEKKRQQQQRRPRPPACAERMSQREDPESVALTSYARNKINNSKSHIAPPTYESSTLTLDSPVLECVNKRQATTAASARRAKPKTVQPRKTDLLPERKKLQPRNAEVGIQVEHGRDKGS